MTRRLGAGFRRGQRGTVLIISMAILLTMTLIGLTAMRSTVLEEKMAGNMKEQNKAFQAAEAGLREALDFVEKEAKSPTGMPVGKSDGSTGIWMECAANQAPVDPEADPPPTPVCGNGTTVVTAAWLEGRSDADVKFGAYMTISNPDLDKDPLDASRTILAALPRTIVEERYAPPPELEEALLRRGVIHFTVTTVGYGGTTNARALTQSTVAVPRL